MPVGLYPPTSTTSSFGNIGSISQGTLHSIEAAGNSLNETFIGASSYGEQGTPTTRVVANTNLFTSVKRKSWVSGTAAGSNCGYFTSQPQWLLSSTASVGGFDYCCRFGVADAATVANARMFVGFGPYGAPTSVNPTTLTNVIGVGCDAGETVLKFIWNDGTGTASSLSLGASFPSQTLSTDWYELRLYAAPGALSVKFTLTNITSGATTTQTITTTDLPASGFLLAYNCWRDNGSTALAVAIDRSGQYINTVN